MENNKPNKGDIAAFISQMKDTQGWTIFDKWLQERLDLYQQDTIETLDPVKKGRVQMLQEINQQLKDYEHGKRQ